MGMLRMEEKVRDKENPIVQALMNYKYEDEKINKQVAIYKRTKKERIKNKKFVQVMSKAIKERGIIKCGELVLMDTEIQRQMNNDLELMKNHINEMEKEKEKRRTVQQLEQI
jgi:TPP-dependent pyruvate/acetoin dehydrogenase alpha subunit